MTTGETGQSLWCRHWLICKEDCAQSFVLAELQSWALVAALPASGAFDDARRLHLRASPSHAVVTFSSTRKSVGGSLVVSQRRMIRVPMKTISSS